ncbi:MAG: pyruvate, phosphate dikinase/phosphoenolpyruvate synthase regulator [Thermodesulfobacteriota bacterium]|nr:pyruvate, phosphate dikinase/phosphoenolpyruvate synthase regulator [Thermodesulfobacteriota bacterium]
MWKSKEVYYISDSTAILVKNLGHSLICQFPEINFIEEKIPFVNSVKDARKTLASILKRSGGRQPIVFVSIMNEKVRNVFKNSEIEFFDAYSHFLTQLENCLEATALRVAGHYRTSTDVDLARRAENINFSLEHDDGARLDDYPEADVILLGISRTGKTPISVYLATQMNLKAANFPLTDKYLTDFRLPDQIMQAKHKAMGLTTTPELLSNIRDRRLPGSNYARRSTCLAEIDRASEIYKKYKIPIISSAGKSIEEMATQVSQELKLSKNTKSRSPRM